MHRVERVRFCRALNFAGNGFVFGHFFRCSSLQKAAEPRAALSGGFGLGLMKFWIGRDRVRGRRMMLASARGLVLSRGGVGIEVKSQLRWTVGGPLSPPDGEAARCAIAVADLGALLAINSQPGRLFPPRDFVVDKLLEDRQPIGGRNAPDRVL